MNLICPVCGSTNLTNERNGQGPDCTPIDENDELYVALDNDWFDGPVDFIKCENGHRFYFPQPDAFGYGGVEP